ncbi:WAT1-related protein [Rhynchospora pubera]|uniref:WAT1-related protein n=1 Tax=Rhynchospora pubera TaxID=906938 RepID=A0AAV8EUZ9_9POAL|nr:WAT1-related protein [Rhynchospora pubera]KAJ4803148.1 WAT1-related protein [Rhynchospora pubera]
MGFQSCGLRRYKAHVLMTFCQMGYTILYFLTEAAFNRGLNPYIYVTYRHILAAVVVWPFAWYLERKIRPKMTWALFLEISVLSLLGVSLTLNMYFTSLKYTSSTFVSSMVNTVASMTFVIAILLRLEYLDVKSARGLAKILGTIVSLAGVTIMTLYKGPAAKTLWHGIGHIQAGHIHENWLKGALLTIASCISWSIWYIMQAVTLKRYPAQLSLTAWMSLIGGAQSAIFTACIERKPDVWIVGFDLKLWAIIYTGLVCSGLIIYIQLWCTEEKGPVFVTMFNPVCTIMVAIFAYFVFGERLYIGSIIGGLIVMIGLYMVLWGKDKDQVQEQRTEKTPDVSNENCRAIHTHHQGTHNCNCGDGDHSNGAHKV